MNPTIPGNEPDSGDMSFDPLVDPASPRHTHTDPGLAEEDEATKLGDFA
jgi:hypothetical protein